MREKYESLSLAALRDIAKARKLKRCQHYEEIRADRTDAGTGRKR